MPKRTLALTTILLGILATVVLPGCTHMPMPVQNDQLHRTYFTRYTIRGTQDGLVKRLYNSNYLGSGDVIPIGKKVTIEFYSREWIMLTVDGIPCKMYPTDLPFPTDNAGVQNFLGKHFANSESELRLDILKESSRRNIENGQAALGMTKEEVLLANGYPVMIDAKVPAAPLDRNRIQQSNQWIYYDWNPVVWFPVERVYQFNRETGQLINVIK